MERMFYHQKDSSEPSVGVYDPRDPESYEHYLRAMFSDSYDYETSFLSVKRQEAQMYYYGMIPWIGPYDPGQPYIGEDPNATLGEILNKDNKDQPGRSTYVSTDVRDAVMMMLPSLIRLFAATENPVFLVPRSQAEVIPAEQATDYVNYVFWNDNPGFLNLYGAFKDALTVKTGFLKWWCDDSKERKRKTFTHISAEQIQLILSEDPTAKILEVGNPLPQQIPTPPAPPPMGMGAPPPAQPGAAPGGPAPPPGMPPGPMAGAPPPAPPPGGPGAAGAGGMGSSPGMAQGAPGAGPGGPGGGAQAQGGAPQGGPVPGALSGANPPPLPPALTQPPPPVFDHVVIEYEESKPIIKVCGVPPEEMRLDRYARSFKESRVVGHERIVPVDQLIAMGYDRETCIEHVQSGASAFTTEPQLRNASRFMGTRMGDGVLYGEWYVRIDKDGDGHPELRYVCTMGEHHEIVSDEYANRVKFAHFGCDPISHTIVGDSLADYTADVQRIKTNMMRSILDSAAESINPKTVVNELVVTIDDAMNDDVGAVIRTRGDPRTSVMYANVPFLGQQAMPVVEMLNAQLQRRTGLSDAAKGLDPKALQSSTMIGVEAVINGAQERTEMVARVLAETGFKDLFVGLYNEICDNPNQKRTIKVRGSFVPYDTGTFDASMAVEVNENLGKGSDMVRMLALNQIKQDQQMIITQYGLSNPVCGVPEMLNTITDMLALANVKNVGRYFKTPTPQQMQAIMSQPKPPDPNLIAAQAQMEKVRSDTAKAVGRQNFDETKLEKENQFKHQQLQAKTAYEFQKLQLEGQKAGVDHQTALAQLQSQLIKTQSDSDQADMDNQQKMAAMQQQSVDSDRAHQQAQNDVQLKAAQLASQHMSKMAQINSGHIQNMTQMAANHHAAMTGHSAGIHNTNSKLVAGALSQGLDHDHEAEQNELDRTHEAATSAMTMSHQERLAKMKPNGPQK